MLDGSVFLTRYADIVVVYNDPVTFNSEKRAEFGQKIAHRVGCLIDGR